MPDAGAPARPRWRRLGIAALVALVTTPLVLVAIASTWLLLPARGFLEVEMRATGGTKAQLFWLSNGGFSEAESSVVPLHTHPGAFERVRFPLPAFGLEYVRFDPLDGPGEILIRQMRIVDAQGRTVRALDPSLLSPIYQIALITRVGTDLRIVTTPAANDPMLLFRSQWVTAQPRWYSLPFVTPFSLTLIAVAAVGMLAIAIAPMTRSVIGGRFGTTHALWFAALFLVVVAAKLTLLQHYPAPVPYWDQWEGEAASLYIPFQNDALTWRVMFAPHNEHRIFFTRVLALVLLAVNGQWDPHLQIVVNIVVHAAASVVLAGLFWLAAGRRWLEVIAVTVALAVAPPFALENTLAGFQSAFYFLVLISTLALWLMGTRRVGSAAWFVGWLCAFSAIFTVAGGILTVPAIGCVVVLRTLANPREWRQGAVNVAALASVAVVGYLAMSPPIAAHDFLMAHTWQAFKVSFARNLAFPWLLWPRASLLTWLPMVVLAIVVLARRFRTSTFERCVIGLGAWTVLQAAAVAYSRGANGAVPASRYLDTLSLGFVVNTMALLFLVAGGPLGALASRVRRPARRAPASAPIADGWPGSDRRPAGWQQGLGWVAVTAWVAVGAVGLTRLSEDILAKDGYERRLYMRTYVDNIRRFIATDEAAMLMDKRGPQEIPHYSPSMLLTWFREPYIRGILPPVLRAPLALTAKPGTAATFSRASGVDLVPVWDSFAGGGAAAIGHFESAPVRCAGFHQLRFDVAGNPGEQGLRLSLIDESSGAETPVAPALGSGNGWRSVHVRCPDGPFSVVADDTSPTASFGFRPPTEIAWASALAELAVQRSTIFDVLAAATTLLAVGLSCREGLLRRRQLQLSQLHE